MPLRPAREFDATDRLLLIDQDATARRRLAETLAAGRLRPAAFSEAATGRSAMELLRAGRFDFVVFDLASIGDLADSVEGAVARLVRVATGALLLALSDGESVSAAVAAMQSGAHECMGRPRDLRSVSRRLDELARRHGRAPVAREQLEPATSTAGLPFIAASSQMQVVDDLLTRAAASSAPVFLTGELGVGKGYCAEVLHARSARAGRRFVAVSCAALPADAAVTAIFGAPEQRGAVDLADGGTLFFDELSELDAAAQGQVLRLLHADPGAGPVPELRLICATSRTPAELVAEHRLREDLFYRLHVLPIHVPPLRQRPADIPALAAAFLQGLAREEHKHFTGFSVEAERQLAARDWPGNARQLQAFIRRLVVLCDGGEIGPAALAFAGIDEIGTAEPVPRSTSGSAVLPMWQEEQRIIEAAVARFGGNVALAAAALELSPSTIYRKRQAWAGLDNAKGAA